MRTAMSSLPRKPSDNGEDTTYNFTGLRVGYRMPRGNGGKVGGIVYFPSDPLNSTLYLSAGIFQCIFLARMHTD